MILTLVLCYSPFFTDIYQPDEIKQVRQKAFYYLQDHKNHKYSPLKTPLDE